MSSFADFTITSLETITGFDITSGAWLFTLDELQSSNISQSQESTDITGKQGRKLNTLKRNKAVTISGDNGLVSGGLFALQTGNEWVDASTTGAEVQWTDYLTVNSNAATTTYKAIGTAGNEIETVYVKAADGTIASKLTQDSQVAAGKFTYTPNTKALAFNASEIADGTEIVVYYKRKIAASKLVNKSDNYSGKCVLYVDFLAEDKCANVYRGQFYIPKADFKGDFSFDMGDNQTIHSFEADALAGSCGNSGEFFTFTIFGATAGDLTT